MSVLAEKQLKHPRGLVDLSAFYWGNIGETSGCQIKGSLGWPHVPEKMERCLDELRDFRRELKAL